uniref:Uncharacterized protein n=1 Tax=Pristionchus pacificus TaxID=54126 RepID=A0A8R1UUR1_PRIPA
MGSSSSKQLPTHTSSVRNSVVLCDGLPRMHEVKNRYEAFEITGKLTTLNPWYAGSNCGRFNYMLGHQIISRPDQSINFTVIIQRTPSTDYDSVTTFDLDIVEIEINLTTVTIIVLRRTRIENSGDFFNYGATMGFYYLSDQTVVIVDYDRNSSTLRQRLIQIDMIKETAICHFYRGYSIDGLEGEFVFDLHVHARTSIGEDLAITVIPNRDMETHGQSYTLGEMAGTIYPLNPLSKRRSKRITDLIEEVFNNHNACRLGEGLIRHLRMIPLRDGHFILASLVIDNSESRLIGEENVKKAEEKFRLIRSPQRSHLASITVQKIDQVPHELMEQLATRFMS